MGARTLQLLHLLLAARHLDVGALPAVVDALQPRAVLTERRLHLDLLLDRRIRQLRTGPDAVSGTVL